MRRPLSLVLAVLAAFALLGAAPTPVAAAPAALAPRVLYYDAQQAGRYTTAVHQGASNWNASVVNVQLRPVPAGQRANITVIYDTGWPRALTTSLGNGRIYMGKAAVDLGHSPPRIAAHEFGHLLGLPDRRTGQCADLMSGSSAAASCTNAFPNATEAGQVDARFRPRAGTAATDVARWYDVS